MLRKNLPTVKQLPYTSTIRSIVSMTDFTLVNNATSSESTAKEVEAMVPEQVVEGLNKHIVGQMDAKKAVAIALRNRWRRQQLPEPLKSEISPMNILLAGPTGSGKTEIARRLAKMTKSPFIKVESTKFTEVGIYGANADSMIKDLIDVAVDLERSIAREEHAVNARQKAIDRLATIMASTKGEGSNPSKKEWIKTQLAEGALNDQVVSVKLKPIESKSQHLGAMREGMELPPEMAGMMKNLNKMMKMRTGDTDEAKPEKMRVEDILNRFEQEESENMIDDDLVVKRAIEKAQTNGIIFIDEIDKLADTSRDGSTHFKKGEGVQKELLALTEGCAVHTRHGLVYTDHILFIASGAFHRCTPSDLMPELQGRLPIRVNLSPLGEEEFVRILKETHHNTLHQAKALLETEGIIVDFTDCAIREIAHLSAQVNSQTDDVGARRLATVVSKIIEDVSFQAPSLRGTTYKIDADYVKSKLKDVVSKSDLSRYIL